MATATAKFNAVIPGMYRIGYRTYQDPATTYHTTDINVATTGVQTFDIPVTGNLYCADQGITYYCWVVPFCLGLVDSNLDGVPDEAISFEIVVPQVTDIIANVTIECVVAGPSSLPLDEIAYDSNFTSHDGLGDDLAMVNNDTVNLTIAADQVAIIDALPDFTVTVNGNGHCQACANVTVDAAAAVSGEGILVYTQCWDLDGISKSRIIYRKILPGQTYPLACVDPDTVNVIDGTLNVTPTITSIACS
jgi:hypothetical protein